MRYFCLVSATVGLFASALSLRSAGGAWFGAAGLLFSVPFLAQETWGQFLTLTFCASLLGLGVLARWRWRVYRAKLTRWREGRALALERELSAIRQRGHV